MAHIVSVRKSFARYTVEFDDGSSMFARAKDIKKLDIAPGTEIGAEELVKLLRPLQLDDAYEAALTILDTGCIQMPPAVLVHKRRLHVTDSLLRADDHESFLLGIHHSGAEVYAVPRRIPEIRA